MEPSRTTTFPPPARYFPVAPQVYRMKAGLHTFGTEFGNGAADRQFFQVDDQRERYLAAKRAVRPERYGLLERDDTDRAIHAHVFAWMKQTLAAEHGDLAAHAGDYETLALSIQEDFAVVRRCDADSEILALYVGLPSGWRPERLLGASFAAIHGPVPSFADSAATNESMVRSMVERGPYVRFVWTVCADDFLDHHPEEGQRLAWDESGVGWLRVERQTTVPFAPLGAALFLIRVYVYPFTSLSDEQRAVLATALELMPPEVQAYKGLAGEPSRVALSLLRR
jgi:hypothetical protein